MLTSAVTVKEKVTGVREQALCGRGGRKRVPGGKKVSKENNDWHLEIKRERLVGVRGENYFK